MSEEEINKARAILEKNGIKLQKSAWQAKVDMYGLDKAREMNRQARSKVKDVGGWKGGRKPRKLGSNAEG